MGKSTLAASFALSEAAFLTDDSLVVDDSDARILALPGHASLRLWEDSVDRLVGEDTSRAGRTSYSSKARLLAGPALAHRDSASPLLAAFVLDNSEPDEVTIRPIVGSQRHMAWVQHSFLLDIQDRDLLSRHFEWTHRIAARVPTFGLDYRRDYDALVRVRRAVHHQVAYPGQGRDLPC